MHVIIDLKIHGLDYQYMKIKKTILNNTYAFVKLQDNKDVRKK